MVEGEWEGAAPNAAAVSEKNDRFNSLAPPTNPEFSPNCKSLANISLKAEVGKLKNHDDFDLLIVSRAKGTKVEKTKTGKAADTLGTLAGAPGPDSDSLSFAIGVVDRATGSFLYYCSSTAGGDYVDRPDARLSGPIRKCLDRYFHGKRK